jgi:hypothetical protein
MSGDRVYMIKVVTSGPRTESGKTTAAKAAKSTKSGDSNVAFPFGMSAWDIGAGRDRSDE